MFIANFVLAFLQREFEVSGWTSTLASIPGFRLSRDGSPIPTALKNPDGTPIFRSQDRPDLLGSLMREPDARTEFARIAKKLGETIPSEADFFESDIPRPTRDSWTFALETCLREALKGNASVYAVLNRADVAANLPHPRLRVGIRTSTGFLAEVRAKLALNTPD